VSLQRIERGQWEKKFRIKASNTIPLSFSIPYADLSGEERGEELKREKKGDLVNRTDASLPVPDRAGLASSSRQFA